MTSLLVLNTDGVLLLFHIWLSLTPPTSETECFSNPPKVVREQKWGSTLTLTGAHGASGSSVSLPGPRFSFLSRRVTHGFRAPRVKGTFSPTSAYMSCTFRFARAIWTAQRLAWKLWFELFSKGQRPLSQLSTRPAAQARWGPFLPLSLSSSSPFLPSFLPALLSKLRSS